MPLNAVHSDYISQARTKARDFLARYSELRTWRALAALNGLPSALTADDLAGANGNVSVADVQAFETLLEAIDGYIAANPAVVAAVSRITIPDAAS